MYISCIFHVYFMYISCIFHVVCASFSALVTQKLADVKADSSGIWAYNFQWIIRNLYDLQSNVYTYLQSAAFH